MKLSIRIFTVLILAFAVLSMPSCLIENDMSYPRIKADITAFEVEGQKSVEIDNELREVRVVLEEDADMANLKVKTLTLSEKAECKSLKSGDVLDLTTPLKVVLSTYQDYEWTIVATQPVERYIKVKGQIGKAEIDWKSKKAHVYVSSNESLDALVIEDMKLEPKGARFIGYLEADGTAMMLIPFKFPLTLDCTAPRKFIVRVNDTDQEWILTAETKKVTLSVLSVDAWCYHVDVKAAFDGTGTPHIEFKKVSESAWNKFENLSVSGLDIEASVTGLEADTEYVVRVVNGDDISNEMSFKTEVPVMLENLNFDSWYSTKSGNHDIWYPNLNESMKVWGTANAASGTFIGSLTTPDESFVAVAGDGKKAARLESKYALIAFAAGNLFTGEFIGLQGLGAKLSWGLPFNGRPVALRGHYAYSPKKIDYAKAPYENLKGTMDKGQIFIMLTDWDQPFIVNTTAGTFVDQSKNNKSIIAYGKIENDIDTQGQYRDFRIDLEYWRPGVTPKYIVIVACSSYKGDYFTGGVGSTLHVDELELVYE